MGSCKATCTINQNNHPDYFVVDYILSVALTYNTPLVFIPRRPRTSVSWFAPGHGPWHETNGQDRIGL